MVSSTSIYWSSICFLIKYPKVVSAGAENSALIAISVSIAWPIWVFIWIFRFVRGVGWVENHFFSVVWLIFCVRVSYYFYWVKYESYYMTHFDPWVFVEHLSTGWNYPSRLVTLNIIPGKCIYCDLVVCTVH